MFSFSRKRRASVSPSKEQVEGVAHSERETMFARGSGPFEGPTLCRVEADGDSFQPAREEVLAFESDAPDLSPHYQNLHLIGVGATARVYKAFDSQLQRWVALKILRSDFRASLEMVLAEARAQAMVEHPNVCKVYELGEAGGTHFIAMQLVEGASLSLVFKRLETGAQVRLVRDLAEGVHAAHQRGLIHLDIKLGNILVNTLPSGELHPLITDFGMVRSKDPANRAGCPLGTPPYSSPEQIKGDPSCVDHRSDIYSLGVVLYVLLTDAFPFEGHRLTDVLDAIQHQEPVPLLRRKPELSRELDAIISKCLKKDPLQRYESAQALAEDLDRFLKGKPVEAMYVSVGRRVGHWAKRNRRLLAVSCLGFVLASSAAIWLGHRARFNRWEGEWAQRFEQEVNELEAFLNRVYSQPYHSLTVELQSARDKVRSLERRVAQGGRAAEGPGHYALARAYELVHKNAFTGHLQKAWDLGFRTEPVRWEIAAQHLQQYSDLVRAMPEDAIQGQHLRAFYSDRFLKPAQKIITDEVPQRHERKYLLLKTEWAIANGNYEEAIQLFKTARETRPWDFQAFLDEASCRLHAVRVMAIRAQVVTYRSWLLGVSSGPRAATEWGALERELKTSEGLIQEAMRLAPSCPDVYAFMADRWHLATTYGVGSSPEAIAKTEKFLTLGLAIAPDDPGLLTLKNAHLLFGRLKGHLETGMDPAPVLQAFADNIRQVPTTFGAHRILIQYKVALAAIMGKVEAVDWRQYLDDWERGNESQPPELDGRLDVAHRPLLFDDVMLESGQNPVPPLRRVMAWVERCKGRLSVRNYELFMARCALQICQYHALCGLPFEKEVREAQTRVRAFQQADPNAQVEIAWLHGWLSRMQCQNVSRDKGEALLQPALDLLRNALMGAGGSGAEIHRCRLEFMEVSLSLARLRMGSGKPYAALLEGLRAQAEQALAFFPASTVVPERLAEASLLEAEAAVDPFHHLTRGLNLARQALVYPEPLGETSLKAGVRRPFPPLLEYPHVSRSLYVRGTLERAWAKGEKSPDLKRVWLDKAEESLGMALAKNANLQVTISSALADIQAEKRLIRDR